MTVKQLRLIESAAGRNYWQTWARQPAYFDNSWRRAIPDHWHSAGPRTSKFEDKNRARKATTPVHAILSYSYAILEAEAVIAAHKLGFDPSLGLKPVVVALGCRSGQARRASPILSPTLAAAADCGAGTVVQRATLSPGTDWTSPSGAPLSGQSAEGRVRSRSQGGRDGRHRRVLHAAGP